MIGFIAYLAIGILIVGFLSQESRAIAGSNQRW